MADSHIQITGLTLKPIPIASTDLFAIDDKDAKSYKVSADMMSVFALNIPQPSANLTAKGMISSFTVAEIMTFGQPCFVNSDGKMEKSDAEFGGPLATHLAIGSYAADATGNFLKLGNIRNDSWAWTVGGTIYLSTTATLVQTAPSSGTDAQQILGVATSATIILFDPTPVAFTQLGKTLSVSASAAAARATLSAASSGVNSDITSLTALATPLSVEQGGTAAITAGAARTSLGVPSLSGTGATGTWGINISGNAATATSATTAGSATTATTATNVSGGTASVTTLAASGQVTFSGLVTFNGAPATLTGSGWGTIINAAETVAFGQIGYITSSGTLGKADMDVAAKSPAQYFILDAGTVGQPIRVLDFGYITLSTWTWTPGTQNPIYLSTAGGMSQAPSWITDSKMQKLAVPLTATTIRFNAVQFYDTHV